MIRRGFAGLILGLSLIIASFAWSGYLALQTIFDPNESSEIAADLLDESTVRTQLVHNIANAIESAVPAEIDVPAESLDAAAATVLEDPTVKALIIDAFAATHGAFLGEGKAPQELDGEAMGTAIRAAAVAQIPELDALLPAAPVLVVPLPTERVPNAGPVRRFLQAVVPPLAALAVVGVITALVTTNNRPSILRRAGIWALGTTAFILAIGLGIPWLITRLAPDQAAVVGVFISTVLQSTIPPAIALAATGVGALVLSVLWPTSARRPQKIRADRPVAPTQPANPPRVATQPVAPPRMPHPDPTIVAPRPNPVTPPAAQPTIVGPMGASPPIVPTRSAPRPVPPNGPAKGVAPPPKWVDGVGWVIHPGDPNPPPNARWRAGYGYVVEVVAGEGAGASDRDRSL